MNNSCEILHPDDVIHTGSSALMFQCTFKVSEFLAMMQSKLEEEYLFATGMDCSLLKPKQPWRQGKVQVCLQFTGETAPKEIEEIDEIEVAGATVISRGEILDKINLDTAPPPIQRKIHPVGMWS